jgi:pimeloyl-ACP methyl ester carboxylesterase
VPEDKRIVFRIGINVGDIVIDGDDIFGDGVNVAARLETLCEPGGICISRAANDQIRDKLRLTFADFGEHTVKNIARAIGVFGLRAQDIAALPEEPVPAAAQDAKPADPPLLQQEIRFCKAQDGVEIAYSRIGRGPPLVKTGNWMTHLEFDLESPMWRHLYRGLAKEHELIRYDSRGNGLSDWDVEDISFDALVRDLDAVVDATGIERFALFGLSAGCAVAIAYAARHPERVTHLVLYGGFAVGWNKGKVSEARKEENAAMLTLMRLFWGRENPAFRQLFTSQFIPEGTKEQADWFNELQRISASPENAARHFEANGEFDVRDLLPKVTAPTLVMHARDAVWVPFELGRKLAAKIRGARFVALQSRNHLILEHEPAYARFVEEMRAFLRT